MLDDIEVVLEQKGASQRERDVTRGFIAYGRSLRTFMVPLADRIKGAHSLLAERDPSRFIMAVAEALDNKDARIKELENLVDVLSD